MFGTRGSVVFTKYTSRKVIENSDNIIHYRALACTISSDYCVDGNTYRSIFNRNVIK